MTRKQMLYVNAYWTNQGYGGPEEGGWWYTYGEPTSEPSTTFFNLSNAGDYCRRMNADADKQNRARGARGDIGSVICEGALSYRVERHPPAPFPVLRPHYE
jgi:hypothetical protein